MSKGSFKSLVSSQKPVLIDFYADWCGPCKMIAPIMKHIKKDYGEKIIVVKIDTEKNQTLSSKLEIRSIPTLMIFQNGEAKWRAMGVQTKALIESKLNELL